MRVKKSKLDLRRETVRQLTTAQLGGALGGVAMPSLTSWCNCSANNTLCNTCV